jgi:hypothetical protein
MHTNRINDRPLKHSVGAFDFYAIHDGSRAVVTELMIPAGTRIRRMELI